MSKTAKIKLNITLLACVVTLTVSFFVAGAAVVSLFTPGEKQDTQSVSPTVLPPLKIEPNRLDFFGEGEEKKHVGIVHLKNHSDRKITLLFAKSSCRCSVAELPGDSILPGEQLPMKCTLSTAGQVSDRAGGEIWIAYRFSDSDAEDTSPMYVRVILSAVVESVVATD